MSDAVDARSCFLVVKRIVTDASKGLMEGLARMGFEIRVCGALLRDRRVMKLLSAGWGKQYFLMHAPASKSTVFVVRLGAG
jgi:hypothetical protein